MKEYVGCATGLAALVWCERKERSLQMGVATRLAARERTVGVWWERGREEGEIVEVVARTWRASVVKAEDREECDAHD